MNTEQLHRLRYRYPGLDEADLLIEASWQELEHKAERKPKCLARRRIVDKFTKPMLARMDEQCMLEQAVGARAFSAELEPVSLEMDYDFEAERQRMMDEIRERLERLRELGVDELILRKLLEKEDTLSRLVVTRDYRILLPDYHNMEIEMTPLPKAVFLLFLKHEEGIPFKFLSDYEDELRDIYMRLTDRSDRQKYSGTVRPDAKRHQREMYSYPRSICCEVRRTARTTLLRNRQTRRT